MSVLRNWANSRAFFGGVTVALLATAAIWCFVSRRQVAHRVVSESMAPHLYGPHSRFVCDDCRFAFACGVEGHDLTASPVCPNCGHIISGQAMMATPGDVISVISWEVPLEHPQRWETVLFQHADDMHQLAVKRIVGLPGEQVAIDRGDLVVDGTCPARTLDQFCDTAILVYDDRYRLKQQGQPPRWQRTRTDSDWRIAPQTLLYESATPGSEPGRPELLADSADVDWITYQHYDCSPDSRQRWSESSINDYLAYNQHLATRRHYVTDLMLRCRVSISGEGWMACRIRHGKGVVVAKISPAAGRIALWTSTGPVEPEAKLTPPLTGGLREVLVEMAVYDHQAVVALNGTTVIAARLDASAVRVKPASQPISISAHAATVGVEGTQILRDVYYLDPSGANPSWSLPRRLGPEEYFLLGDNPAVSIDSRHYFEDRPVQRKWLRGKALKVDR